MGDDRASDANPFYAKYVKEVLSRDKSPFRASLLWFQEMEAIDESDIQQADRIRQHRNEIAHNLMKFVASTDHEIDMGIFASLLSLVRKIDQWWICEIEIPTSGEYKADEVDTDNVASMRMIFLGIMCQIASGDEDASELWEQFARATEGE